MPAQSEIMKGLTTRQKEILNILKHKPLSRDEIAERLQGSLHKRTIQRDLALLYNLKIINQSRDTNDRFKNGFLINSSTVTLP